MRNIIIYAPNVNSGGGLNLLVNLLESRNNHSIIFYIDDRLRGSIDHGENIRFIKKNIFSQLICEYKFFRESLESDIFLSFSSRPLIFNLKSKNYIFLQNYYLVILSLKNLNLTFFNLIKFFILRAILKYSNVRKNTFYIVQNYFMYNSAINFGLTSYKIFLRPFFDLNNKDRIISKYAKDINVKSFYYPASFQPHKNHQNLIKAWLMVKKNTNNIQLHLSINDNEYKKLINDMNLSIDIIEGLNIINHGFISYENSLKLMAGMNCLIFPSLFESFGLPLLEASEFGLDIIASELDYVRDLPIVISQTFDPKSPLSIARAIKRYIGQPIQHLDILSPDEFINKLI